MPLLFTLPNGYEAHVLEHADLSQGNHVANDPLTAQWIELGINESWFASFGHLVDLDEWAAAVADGWQHGLDVAIRNPDRELQVANILMGGNWLHGPDVPAVEVALRRTPTHVAKGSGSPLYGPRSRGLPVTPA